MNELLTLEDLISSIVYDSNSDIDQIYKDLKAIRKLPTLNRSDHPKAYKVRDELGLFIETYKLIFKSKGCILEIDIDPVIDTEDEFGMTIGDNTVFNTDECFSKAIEAGVVSINRDNDTIRIYGSDLVKYEIAEVSEIMWNILWSGVRIIKFVDVKTNKEVRGYY